MVGQCRSPSSYPAIANLSVDDVGELGGGSSNANGINAFGQVVGSSHTASGLTHSFAWDGGGPGAIVDIGVAPGFMPSNGATSINDYGTIAGGMSLGGDGPSHVYRYTSNGLQDLGVGGDDSITSPDGWPEQGASAYGMNATGQLTGWFTNGGVMRGFRYTDEGGFQDIGDLAGGRTLGFAISDAGLVVGSSWVPGSTSAPADYTARRLGHAVIWNEEGDGLADLNNFIDPIAGWVLHSGDGISPNGRYIAGTGEIGGVLRAYRLDTNDGTIIEVSNSPGDAYGGAVNDNGDVIGFMHPDVANQIQKAFIYTDRDRLQEAQRHRRSHERLGPPGLEQPERARRNRRVGRLSGAVSWLPPPGRRHGGLGLRRQE